MMNDFSIPNLFDKISRIMETQFNNLRYEADWDKLFRHLFVQISWRGDNALQDASCKTILRDFFNNEYQSAVVLLLQSLSPIRFAFMDGQARMSSLYYFQRKLIPHLGGKCSLLSTASGLSSDDIAQRWSLAPTGDLANCRIYLPSAEHAGQDVSRSYMSEMLNVSKEYEKDRTKQKVQLDSMMPTNLNDCIIEMINKYRNQRTLAKASTITMSLTDAFRQVLRTMYEAGPLLQPKVFGANLFTDLLTVAEDTFLEEVYKKVYTAGDKLIYASFSKGKRTGSALPELMILMLVLGTALVDVKSRASLEKCVNNDWIVPLSSMANNYKVTPGEFHKGTFVSDSYGHGTYFQSHLYLVSCMHG